MNTYGTYCRLNVHVGATSREVIKAALRRVHILDRAKRHAYLRSVLGDHARALKLYRQVMSGDFS